MSESEPRAGIMAEMEAKWQARWAEEKVFRAERRPGRAKKYILDMFPYPSGSGLHVGHPEGYTATDIVARHARMCGLDVLHPMGWDAFGLPAEQYAIQTGTHPRETTAKNVATFRRQLQMLGFSYDWEREVDTTDPTYVRWTQWIFLQLFRRGLAYQAEISVNWCPALGTVLANEEVKDGKSERGGHAVVRAPLRQWMLKITAYADRLLEDLEQVRWPAGTLAMQREWIGRSLGAEIDFPVAGASACIRVFTTRADTLMGATYVVVAPEHPLTKSLTTAEQSAEMSAYVEATSHRSDRDRTAAKDKTGVFTGSFAEHPLTGARLPIWAADYVLAEYGTGAVMAVPGHDERDFEFAKKMGLPIVEVVSPDGTLHGELKAAFVDDGVAVRSGAFDGLRTPACKAAVVEELARRGRGAGKVTYKLRDWVFSRQRYWGEPIPIYFPVELPDGGDPRAGARFVILHDQPIAVAESELPLCLPDTNDFQPGDDPAGPLARLAGWRFFQKDDRWYARETNTMPQWAGSCWYYLRYLDPKNAEAIFDPRAQEDWMPVDLYVGGAEHAVLHLLYARFWHKVLFDCGVVKHPEPFLSLVHQGIILGEDGQKMAKSRGNVVNPDDIVRAHGADVLRLYEMFMGPLEVMKPWQSGQITGVARFRDRALALADKPRTTTLEATTEKLTHRAIKKVGEDIAAMSFNTAISALMVLCNHLTSLGEVPEAALDTFARLLSPFAPHTAEELWERLGRAGFVCRADWPAYRPELTIDDVLEIAVQVNGKVRGRVVLGKDALEAEAREAALGAEGVAAFTEGKTVKKFIYVPGKIVNLVVA